MLPELFFSVGSTMQDISREEFVLLNAGCDKDITHPNVESTLDRIKLGRIPDYEPVSIKLEETADIFPWHAPTDIGSNLLRHSDDPLISGAIDDNQNEFNPITSCDTLPTPTSPVIIEKKKSTRARKKGQFKLRFHHQALPPEYLDHYEASQNISQQKIANHQLSTTPSTNNLANQTVDSKLSAFDTPEKPKEQSNESIRNWLQKISEFQVEILPSPIPSSKDETDIERSTATNANCIRNNNTATTSAQNKKSTRVISYNDLPYMGEMTLDNSKPRRGRKPKKADICHLIYKNYGTIFPGTPKDMMENEISAVDSKKSDIQTKIISSLLEKRLTQEDKNHLVQTTPIVVQETKSVTSTTPDKTCDIQLKIKNTKLPIIEVKQQAEPLNLCVRDYSDTLTLDTDDDSESVIESCRSSPTITPSDLATDALLAANLKMSLPNFQTALTQTILPVSQENKQKFCSQSLQNEQPLISRQVQTEILSNSSNLTNNTPEITDTSNNNDNYIYWSDAGVFIHPMALYYQKMVDVGSSTTIQIPSPISSSISSISVPSVSPITPLPSPSPPSTHSNETKQTKILVPKNITQLLRKPDISKDDEHLRNTPSRTQSDISLSSSSTSMSAATSSQTGTVTISEPKSNKQTPQKRKRSAIFIPPLPADTSSNHATEVSICKFKFTGGAKPTLQEKKMLSVDSGGNFRYYSGTGDKSMRGYEFFPRESLQQSSLLAASSSGAFLNTHGEKISIDLPLPTQGLSNELLQIPEILPTISSNISTVSLPTQCSHRVIHSSDRRKRKSRRSIQREKLEKTFKEKGFLIQTQQLESAEGATYCKFRQLRKFTRYLFRSWKDYLPGDIQQSGVLPNNLSEAESTSRILETPQASNSNCTITSEMENSEGNIIKLPSKIIEK